MSKKTSVIIINYNTFQLTYDCIKSVYNNTKTNLIEIVLVDNASTERNPDDFLIDFPELILLKMKQNLGFAKGNNEGIKMASGDLILLLNSDTVLINSAIENIGYLHPIIATLIHHNGIGCGAGGPEVGSETVACMDGIGTKAVGY